MKNARWILILGANSDIAISIARCYAKSGFNLYLAARNISECEKNAADLMLRFKVKTQCLLFDALDFDNHIQFYQNLKDKPWGVVVAFGVMFDQIDSQNNFNLTKRMIETNYTGTINILEIIASDFEKRKFGFIVGISSVAGDRGRMSNYIYGSTKAAFSNYLAGLCHRLVRSNITVLNVKPGFVSTKMTKHLSLPKILTANTDQVANAIYKAVNKKKTTIYVLPIWRIIMLFIVHLPDTIFHKTKL